MRYHPILRKIFHACGSAIPLFYFFTDKKSALLLVSAFLFIDGIIEYLRISGRLRTPLIESQTKETEAKKLTGSFYYLLSALITIAIFEKTVAASALLVLAFCDPLSSVIGSRWGRTSFLGKTLEGSLTFFAAATFILLFLRFPLPSALAAAAVASLTELISSRFVDDNLSIPMMTAITLTLGGLAPGGAG